jgi:hypothetical protein
MAETRNRTPNQRDAVATGGPAPASRHRVVYAMIALLIVGLGLASRAFPHYVPGVLGKYPGDCLWAMVAFMIMAILMRLHPTGRIGLIALVFCFAVEALKLVPSAFLASARHTTVGHLFLGHTFMWQNLIAYSVGIVGAMGVDLAICSRFAMVQTKPNAR